MRNMRSLACVLGTVFFAAVAAAERDSDTVLKNAALRLEFDREAGGVGKGVRNRFLRSSASTRAAELQNGS
jgi:hypothetical protein